MSLVEAYGAVVAYELCTGLAVDLETFFRMLWAVHDLLSWRYKVGRFFLDVTEASYLVGAKFFPCLVNLSALIADKLATVTTESCCQSLFTFSHIVFSVTLLLSITYLESQTNAQHGNQSAALRPQRGVVGWFGDSLGRLG